MQTTEMRNEKTVHIDKASAIEMLQMMNEENRRAVEAVGEELEQISAVVEKTADSFSKGGRLIYIGAGTSGRLGILDAAECPPTFGVDENTVIGIIAGGEQCMTKASEGAEDNEEAGRRDLAERNVTDKDIVVGISAAGNAAYVIGALQLAKEKGAFTVSLVCNRGCKMDGLSDISIVTETGPEVITGSTRLKAGTAQKLVLNMLSTGAMIKTGKVYENYMINVKPVNRKLRERCIGIIGGITGEDAEQAEKALDAANGEISGAIELIRGRQL